MKKSRYFTAAIAAVMGVGIIAATAPPANAASSEARLSYEDGASNEYSFRMKEEDRIHDENVRRIKFDFRRDGDQEKYNRSMREEQKRHDQAVKRIMRDYNNRKPWRH